MGPATNTQQSVIIQHFDILPQLLHNLVGLPLHHGQLPLQILSDLLQLPVVLEVKGLFHHYLRFFVLEVALRHLLERKLLPPQDEEVVGDQHFHVPDQNCHGLHDIPRQIEVYAVIYHCKLGRHQRHQHLHSPLSSPTQFSFDRLPCLVVVLYFILHNLQNTLQTRSLELGDFGLFNHLPHDVVVEALPRFILRYIIQHPFYQMLDIHAAVLSIKGVAVHYLRQWFVSENIVHQVIIFYVKALLQNDRHWSPRVIPNGGAVEKLYALLIE